MGGVCSSCESTCVVTAKVILDNGKLLEFPYPVKVSYVVQNINPACFICNSDDMDFDGVAPAVADDEELQPGQVYFALPLSGMERRMRAEEMAALAVKASSALRDHMVVFSGETNGGRKAASGGNVGGRRRGGRRGGRVTARLSGIVE